MNQPDSVNADPDAGSLTESRCQQLRNQAGFWLLGLCNNFAYVVMLSAAHDILKQQESHNATQPVPHLLHSHISNSSNSSRYDCNPVSTAAVLLADILPTLLIKLTAPFCIHKVPYGFRVLFCCTAAAISFLMVSFSSTVLMSIFGVIFASVSSGLGELSFLSLTVYFNSNVLSGWGSGTGGAGVAGAFLYALSTLVGLSPRATLQMMLLIPVFMMLSYFFLLEFPSSFPQWKCRDPHSGLSPVGTNSQERRPLIWEDSEESIWDERRQDLSITDKFLILKNLLRFILPLAVVYFAEYFINQGLLELLFFPDSSFSHADQYRWYQTLYQIGVFLSRTSLYCFKFRWIWSLSFLQCVNAVFLLLAVNYQFLPSVWIVFVIVFYEGLLGGAAYVNIFYLIRVETEEHEREFAMAAASVGDSFGIALSAGAAFPVHDYFCSL